MRSTYYKADADGFLLSTLFLTQEEADTQTGLLTEPPPVRPIAQEVTPSVSDLKAAKNAAINAARLRANQSHFMFAGKQIAVDPLSRSDIDAMHGTVLMLQAMPAGWPGAWKAMDNTFVSIPDVATWGAFYAAMVAQGMQNFAHSQALKAQLEAATTPEEVEAVPVW